MALPTLAKTWQNNHNQTITAQGTVLATNKRVVRTIFNLLQGFGTNPATVRGSSNGVVANTSDNWTTDADIVNANAGTAHSWKCVRQTGIASNYEMVFDYSNSSSTGASATVVISPAAGFTSFTSTTARPTAIDEIVLIPNTLWGGNQSGTDNNVILNVSQSTDGQCTRLWTNYQNTCSGLWIFDKPQNPRTGWTNPSFSFAKGGSSNQATVANLFNTFNGNGRGSANFTMKCTSEADQTALAAVTLTSANDFDAAWDLFPIGFYSTTASHRGRHGTLFDAYLGNSAVPDGDTYPNDPNGRLWVQVGTGLVLPWGLPTTAPLRA